MLLVELSIEEDASESAPVAVPDSESIRDATVSMRAYKVFVKVRPVKSPYLYYPSS